MTIYLPPSHLALRPAPAADDCPCQACKSLRAAYAGHPEQLRFVAAKLLVRGRAGSTDATERAYILAHADWARAQSERLKARAAAGMPLRAPKPSRGKAPESRDGI